METTSEQSSEYLRMALPLISANGLPVTPHNYAIWYTYVAGLDQALKDAIDQAMKDDVVTAELMEQLYHMHLSSCDDRRMQELGQGINQVMNEVAESITVVNSDSDRYSSSLSEGSRKLELVGDTDGIQRIVERLAEETRSMRESQGVFKERLSDSQHEIESLRRELAEVKRQASTDALTGLLNRIAFADAFNGVIDELRENEQSPCVVMLDIDHFKRVNDTYGHLLGDRVIRIVAATISKCIKGKDSAGRFGGEEFILMLPGTGAQGGMAVANSIRNAIERGRIRRRDNGSYIDAITISGGIAVWRPGESLLDVVNRADEALYQAKRGGRNRIVQADT